MLQKFTGETKKAQAWMVYNHLTSQNQNVKQTLQVS